MDLHLSPFSMSLSLSDTAETQAVSPFEDEETVEALADLLSFMSTVDTQKAAEVDKTTACAEKAFMELRRMLEKIAEQNTDLREKIVQSESELRQMEIAHQSSINALKDEVELLEKEGKGLHQSLIQTAQQTEAHVASIEHMQSEAVKVVVKANEARLAAFHKQSETKQTTALVQQKEGHRKALIELEEIVDSIHRSLDTTIKECIPLAASQLDPMAQINGPHVITDTHLVSSIVTFTDATGRLLQSRQLKDLLEPPTQQLKELIKKRNVNNEPTINIHFETN